MHNGLLNPAAARLKSGLYTCTLVVLRQLSTTLLPAASPYRLWSSCEHDVTREPPHEDRLD